MQKSNIAAVDAQTKLNKEDCLAGMGHIAIRMMNSLHLDQNTRRLLQLIHRPISVLLELPSERGIEGRNSVPREVTIFCQESVEV